MSANIITLLRIALAVGTLFMFSGDFWLRSGATFMILIVFYMDALDGMVARKLGVASDFGALFDITGDRIVEHVYLIFFLSRDLISIWVVIIFVARSFLVDTVRSVAFSKEGKTPFGEKSMMRSNFTAFLTSGRFMRGFYGGIKLLAFFMLGMILVMQTNYSSVLPVLKYLDTRLFIWITEVIVWTTTLFCLIRGLPVLWDGRIYLFDKEYPRELKNDV